MRVLVLGLALAIAAFGVTPRADATVTYTASGSSATGRPVSYSADLTISGDWLTVQLFNTSTVPSADPADLLSSFFFDIADSGNRPTLTFVSAVGDVWRTQMSLPDVLQTANQNLKVVVAGDSWEYRSLDETQNPFFSFGIGTVGNSGLAPNNFHGNIVDGLTYSIYAGDIMTRNLDDLSLVKDTATFTFSGVSGFTEADIGPTSMFGLGSGPDSLMVGVPVPEPRATILGALFLLPCGVRALGRMRKKSLRR
jgi:hypothetical protein